MIRRLFRLCVMGFVLLLFLGWAFSHGFGIWSIDWDNPAPVFEGYITQIDTIDGKLVANKSRHRIEYTELDQMPEHLIQAFVAVEDRRFYQHIGIDSRGIARALRINWRTGDIAQGGSTITQQLARNLFLSHDQTIERKLAEMSIALQLERQYTKDEILEMYLNQIYFGAGNWGVARASQAFFGKEVGELNLGEAAVLAGVVQAPSIFAPRELNWDLVGPRQQIVLNRMVSMEFITEEEAQEAVRVVRSE